MNPDKALNSIICKYDLGADYPQFRKMLCAEELILNWMEKAAREQKKILCIGVSREDIGFFSFLGKNYCNNFSYLEFDGEKIDQTLTEGYDVVWVISLKSAYLSYWLKKNEIPYIEIYDELQKQGLLFEIECYRLVRMQVRGMVNQPTAENVQTEIFRLELKQEASSAEEREFYLRQRYFLALYLRDFVYAEKCLAELLEIEGVDDKYIRSWNEIQELLKTIRETLSRRTKKDIIMVWMDALGYDEVENMPYYEHLKETCIDFDNAYTVMPFTRETARTIFLGTKAIDDEDYRIGNIDRTNSKLIAYLESQNYLVKIASGVMPLFDTGLRGNHFTEHSSAISQILWDCLCCMAKAEQSLFFLAHSFAEIHDRLYVSMELADIRSLDHGYHHGKKTLDWQLEYYMNFIGKEAVVIFMSDHGAGGNINIRSHANLTIKGKNYKCKKIQGMFSYANFIDLIKEILEDRDIGEEITTDFVSLQELPGYNKNVVREIVNATIPLCNLYTGYIGGVTKEYIYFRLNTGNERLLRRDSKKMQWDYFSFENVIEDSSPLEYFRSMVGNKMIDIYSDEKFTYTRYLYKLVDNCRQHTIQSKYLINKLFDSFQEGSVALRMGGENTEALYSILSAENRDKIVCCIDKNEDCPAAKIGISVYSPDYVNDLDVKYIVLSTNRWLEELREEAEKYRSDIEVIDLFEYLADHGIRYEEHFGLYSVPILSDECYNVGFPLSE